MAGAAWFHVTGITPALGENARGSDCSGRRRRTARRRARQRRPQLPQEALVHAKAQSTMRPLMKQVDVVIANEEDLQSVLGHSGGGR